MNSLVAYLVWGVATYAFMYGFVSMAMMCLYPGVWSVLDVIGTTRIIVGVIAAWFAWTQVETSIDALHEILEGKHDKK